MSVTIFNEFDKQANCFDIKTIENDIKRLDYYNPNIDYSGLQPNLYIIINTPTNKHREKWIHINNGLQKENQTEELCLYFISHERTDVPKSSQQYYFTLNDVIIQTHKICLAAVKRNGHSLKYVKEQTDDLCIAAVKNSPSALQFVIQQTREICMCAVTNPSELSLQFVKCQTREICVAAINSNYHSLRFVRNQTDEICAIALENNIGAYLGIHDPTPEMCLYFVKADYRTLGNIKNQTLQMCLFAVSKYKNAIIWIHDEINKIMCIEAIKKNDFSQMYNNKNEYSPKNILDIMKIDSISTKPIINFFKKIL